jgi:hypothetical protein
MPPGRCATAICASLLAAGLFINSKSLVGDGASFDLAMVEARRLFRRVSRRRWSVAADTSEMYLLSRALLLLFLL